MAPSGDDLLPSSLKRPPVVVGPSVVDPEPLSTSFQSEDFLFHIYRGSELLADNCVSEAKDELEQALRMQPRDPEGQGLLGIVYFRLGMYPQAIRIYEDLLSAFPDEVTPRVNAALCYLKTGQPNSARAHLEEVIRREPDHKRAWGYLGLTHERLGNVDKARAAYERAGQAQRAHRLGGAPDLGGPEIEERAPPLRIVAEAAPVEPPPAPAVGVAKADDFAREAALSLPPTGVVQENDRVVVARVDEAAAVRLRALLATRPDEAPFRTSELERRMRGRGLGEPLGTVAAPMGLVEGTGHVVLAASEGKRLLALRLDGQLLYLRESRAVAFEGTLHYENGRLVRPDGDYLPMVQLSGHGWIVVEHDLMVRSLAVDGEAGVTVEVEQVVGWIGRLLPRAPRTGESRSLVGFVGSGMLLLELPGQPRGRP